MECRKCKKEIPDESLFCNYCGSKQESQPRSRRIRANGEGCAYKRGKTWTARIVLGYWVDNDGTMHPHLRTKGGFKTKREALDYIPQLKKDSSLNPDLDITFQQLYERFMESHEQKVGESTLTCYRSSFKHYKPIWGMKFRTLGTDDLQDCVDRCERGRRTKELMKVLGNCLFKYAASRKIVTHNYAQYIYVGKDKKGTYPAFTLQQVEQIHNAIGRIPYAEYVYCMIYTGFRPNEMLQLKRDAYHKEGDFEYLVGGFKTEAGTNRKVTISPKIKPYIHQLIMKADPYIFPKPEGGRLTDDAFRDRIFYPLLAALNIQSIPDKDHPAELVPYSCRHTFANLMKNVIGSDTDKSALMGHTDIAMTKYYQSADLTSIQRITDMI